MQIPTALKIYRAACLTLLLGMGAALLVLIWLLSKDSVSIDVSLLLGAAFFFIHFKNAQLGLTLFTKLGQQLPIRRKLRTKLKIYWVLQLVLQGLMAFQIWNTFLLLLNIFKLGFLDSYPAFALLSDLLGLLIFVAATVCLVLLWPSVRFVRQQYHAAQQAKRSNSGHILTNFE
jgi:hypothetical protein